MSSCAIAKLSVFDI